MDCIGEELDKSGMGCRFGSQFADNLWYADDLYLLTSSTKALQQLLDICFKYVSNHNIRFNCKKTVCMKFVPKGKKSCTNPKVVLNDCILTCSNTFNYLGYTMSNEKKLR